MSKLPSRTVSSNMCGYFDKNLAKVIKILNKQASKLVSCKEAKSARPPLRANIHAKEGFETGLSNRSENIRGRSAVSIRFLQETIIEDFISQIYQILIFSYSSELKHNRVPIKPGCLNILALILLSSQQPA